jgi:hypothetical protein
MFVSISRVDFHVSNSASFTRIHHIFLKLCNDEYCTPVIKGKWKLRTENYNGSVISFKDYGLLLSSYVFMYGTYVSS